MNNNHQGDKLNINVKVAATCWLVTLVSFFGFCIENLFVAFLSGYIDNRNMTLPFLLGYGLAAVAVYFLFGKPTSPKFFGHKINIKKSVLNVIIYFVLIFLCISLGECLIGTVVEKVCNVTWWNYSNIPLHITKFTSVPTSIGFTLPIMLFMQFLYEPILKLFEKMNKKVLYTLAIVFMVLLFADCIYSWVNMYLTGHFMRIWQIEF